MQNKPTYKEPISSVLRRHPHGNKDEIANTIRWVGFSTVGIFLTLIIQYLLENSFKEVLIISLGLIPIIVSLAFLKRYSVAIPTTILSSTIILLITFLASSGQGIYDIGTLGYPVILIVAGLILRGRVIIYLAILIIGCLIWLFAGERLGLYTPVYLTQANPQDIYIAIIIILIAGNTVYRLAKNVYDNLLLAEQENKMRQTAEQTREEVIRQLSRKNKELDRFAIRVSHDLKTPLITLAGFLGYLEKDIQKGDFERAVKDFSQINEAAKTMGKFVDELLDLSRVGRITNPPTDVAFDEIVQDALRATGGLLKEKQVQVEIDANLPYVHVDRTRIVQVMQNLIVNAVKFMGEQSNPFIRIGFEEIENNNIFLVQDNGIGIATEHQEKIFELFSKLDATTNGTGIGLGLVKRIVEVHNGRVWVESELGQGSTFKFTLR